MSVEDFYKAVGGKRPQGFGGSLWDDLGLGEAPKVGRHLKDLTQAEIDAYYTAKDKQYLNDLLIGVN